MRRTRTVRSAGLALGAGLAVSLALACFAHPLASAIVPRLAAFQRISATVVLESGEAVPFKVELRRSLFCDWWEVYPRFDTDESPAESTIVARPGSVAGVAPDGTDGFDRIDTGIGGWPFRCMASEAWYPIESGTPDLRWNLDFGVMPKGGMVLVPLRPIWIPLVGNVIFWALVSLVLLAAPRAARVWWRRHGGRCELCGHTVASSGTGCTECGHGLTVAPTSAAALQLPNPVPYHPSMSSSPPHARASAALAANLGRTGDPARPGPAATTSSAGPTGVPAAAQDAADTDLSKVHTGEMRYQSAYVWLIFFSSLDIMLTWAILRRGGEEVNPVAKHVISMWGLHGAIVFKFALMLFVIVSCEVIGRQRDRAGRRLAYLAVGIAAFPVVYSFALLVDHILLRPPPV
ncbi:MAG: hypothetical protein JNL80_08500 [Phycisphaerae bacterium]|nr:hypothetical protein [Phycisphaerae bacterium]